MAIDTQSVICRRTTKLKDTKFQHNDLKYKRVGWNTSRAEANKGISLPEYDDTITVGNNVSEVTLYAVWKQRDEITTYENLVITADNIAFNQTTTNISYSIVLIKKYDGIDKEISRTTLYNDNKIEFVIKEGTNGVDGSENATTPRQIQVSYTHPESGKTAYTTITQGGYTPIYKVQCIDSDRGTIECYLNGKKLACSSDSNGIKTYSSSSKEFKLVAIPKSLSTVKWVANTSCAYYKQPDKWLLHAATYPKNNSCGSWQQDEQVQYNFVSWSGGTITGNTSKEVNIQGSMINPSLYEANYKLLPLVENAVIGSWRQTWTTYTTKTENYTAYKTVQKWIPTCSHDTGRAIKGYTTWDHEGWSGHGYWTSSSVPYTATRTVDVSHTNTNIYYGAKSISAPYTITMPEDGVLKIKGKYGINVYGCSCTRIGGFKILKYSEKNKSFDDFLCYLATLKKEDLDFYKELNVKKGEQYQFTETFSSTLKHIAIYIEKIELDATPGIVAAEDPIVSNSPFIVDDMTDATKQKQLQDKYDNGEKKDYSVKVAAAGKVQRDLLNKPNYSMQLTVDELSVIRVVVRGGHGWGYSQYLKITDVYNNKVLKNIQATGTDLKFNVKGDLNNKICYVYIPPKSKIKIDAGWTTVDTEHFDVWLDVKGVSFKKL